MHYTYICYLHICSFNKASVCFRVHPRIFQLQSILPKHAHALTHTHFRPCYKHKLHGTNGIHRSYRNTFCGLIVLCPLTKCKPLFLSFFPSTYDFERYKMIRIIEGGPR